MLDLCGQERADRGLPCTKRISVKTDVEQGLRRGGPLRPRPANKTRRSRPTSARWFDEEENPERGPLQDRDLTDGPGGPSAAAPGATRGEIPRYELGRAGQGGQNDRGYIDANQRDPDKAKRLSPPPSGHNHDLRLCTGVTNDSHPPGRFSRQAFVADPTAQSCGAGRM